MSPVNYETCSKYALIFNIAENVIEANNGSSRCASGKSTAPEALVMNVCGLTAPSTWKQGVNVMSNCNSIPHYSPVATFTNGQYNPDSCVTGIFISCLTDEDGILMAIQRCNKVPVIEHVVTSVNSTLPDPHSFYTVQLSS